MASNNEGRNSDGSTGRPTADGDDTLPPPLAAGEDGESAAVSHRNRLSRLFDINRLRQAPIEERMAALRQLGAEQRQTERENADGDERGQGARLAERLRERFRIRTRAQEEES